MTIYQCGTSRLRHGTVMDEAGIAELMGSDVVSVFYSDPPWGKGNLDYWATMNRKMTGQEVQQPSLDNFLNRIFSLAHTYCQGYLCIEYGPRWRDMVQERGQAFGFTPLDVIDLLYRSGSKFLPLHLHVFSNTGHYLPEGYADTVRNTYGYDCVKKALSPLIDAMRGVTPEPIVMDPCCGMGYTAQCALDNGVPFRGNELNSARLAKTLARYGR